VTALERYLADSGLGSATAELGRFFAAPASYESALRTRLVDHLARRGRELLATDRAAALQALDRVLTLEPQHEPTLRALDQIARGQRLRRLAMGAGGLLLLGGAVAGVATLITRAPAARNQPSGSGVALLTPPDVDARPATPAAAGRCEGGAGRCRAAAGVAG
jgi:hypothetical protein